MNAAFPSFFYSDSKLLELKARAAWRALERRYAEELTIAELDHLFALYVLGLTSPFFGDCEPNSHLEACRTLVALELTPERVEHALCSVPVASADWVSRAYRSIEQFGKHDGNGLLQQLRNSAPPVAVAGVPIDAAAKLADPLPEYAGGDADTSPTSGNSNEQGIS